MSRFTWWISLTLQFIQQTLQKVIYILNADKNWNNGICIWIRYLLCWSHRKWKHVYVKAQRLGAHKFCCEKIWYRNSHLFEKIQYSVKLQAKLGTHCFISEKKCCAKWVFYGRIYGGNHDLHCETWFSVTNLTIPQNSCNRYMLPYENLYIIYIHSCLYCGVTKWPYKEKLSPNQKQPEPLHLNRTPLHCEAYSLQQNQTSCT